MRLAERHPESPPRPTYTEGELDLEPPEELAIGELDDEAILEEELDNEDLLEQDVDEDTLEASLEDLVHGGDDEDDDDHELRPAPGTLAHGVQSPWTGLLGVATDAGAVRALARDDSDDEVDDDDVEESLDLVLLDRLALLDDGEAEAEAELEEGVVVRSLLLQVLTDGVELTEVAPCGMRRVRVPVVLLGAQTGPARRCRRHGVSRLLDLSSPGSPDRGRPGLIGHRVRLPTCREADPAPVDYNVPPWTAALGPR